MADILDEVLNDEKDEKRLLMFRKALPTIIILTIITAIIVASYNWYQNRKIAHNREIGDMLVELVSGEYGNDALIMETLEGLVSNGENRQTELAELKIVSNLSSTDPKAALVRLEAIIDNKGYYKVTTSFARLLWLAVILDEKVISEAQQAKARDYMQHFTNKEQPFFASATLMKALFYKKNNQNDLSAEYAKALLELDSASLIIKEQARAILANI